MNSPSDANAANRQESPRGWVVRLGSYLRIFGKPDSSEATTAWDGRDQLDRMIEKAKENEGKHGR